MHARLRWGKPMALALIALLALSLGATRPQTQVAHARTAPATDTAALQRAFAEAAREFKVPEPVLLAVAYHVSRWEHHGGEPSTSGGYGLMHLTAVDRLQFGGKGDDSGHRPATALADPQLHTLDGAAALLKLDREIVRRDPVQNIRGGAALLASYARAAGAVPADPADWYGAAARYSGSSDRGTALGFADNVYATIAGGAERTTSNGQHVRLEPAAVTPNRASADHLNLRQGGGFPAECPLTITCEVIPAAYVQNNPNDPSDYGNYDLANRPADGLELRYILIHDAETTYTGTLQTFQNPLSYVSAHYVIRAGDGHVAQMLENKNVGWHAGNWFVNAEVIGIEHEGVAIEGATWYTEAMYQSSARLTRYLADRYGIPKDRAHIVGHDEIPGPLPQHQAGMHWDPGPFWDWAHYMDLVRGGQRDAMGSGDQRIVTINPDFATNMPPMTYCYAADDCRAVPAQSANFLYLRTAPSADAPLIANQYISAEPSRANNWANKALTGQTFFRAERRGEWDAIYFGGQKAWFHNPGGANASGGAGILVAPKPGRATIPVYGRAYPEAEAYPSGVPAQAIAPIYEMPAGQIYVATGPLTSTYYYSPVYTTTLESGTHIVVSGTLKYYQISFNHRFAFVKADDVDLVSAALALDPVQDDGYDLPGATVTYTLDVTNTSALTTSLGISILGQQWPTVLQPPADLVLSPSESIRLAISVAIPAGAPGGSSDNVWVALTNDTEPDRSITAVLTTHAANRGFVPLLVR